MSVLSIHNIYLTWVTHGFLMVRPLRTLTSFSKPFLTLGSGPKRRKNIQYKLDGFTYYWMLEYKKMCYEISLGGQNNIFDII